MKASAPTGWCAAVGVVQICKVTRALREVPLQVCTSPLCWYKIQPSSGGRGMSRLPARLRFCMLPYAEVSTGDPHPAPTRLCIAFGFVWILRVVGDADPYELRFTVGLRGFYGTTQRSFPTVCASPLGCADFELFYDHFVNFTKRG